jgi:hypothetical protein
MSSSWKLNKKDVYWYGSASGNIRNRRDARQPRAVDARQVVIILVHIPTKIEVRGEIIEKFSRREMTDKRKRLYDQLFIELEDKVAKHSRIAGR